eukprot:1497889-Pyramimonas_sp.AAC.1
MVRECPALACDSEKDFLSGILKAEGIRRPRFSYEEYRRCSEWLTTAFRHKLSHGSHLSDRFLREAPS